MKTIHNSDIRFELNPRIIYVSDFEMTFYTVSRGEYYFKKTDADVIEAEVSGDTKYYLDLDWSMLEYVGQGVLNYQCVNNIADPSFPDGEYNQLIEKATDYFIDTFTVEPEGDESIAERLEKEEEERKEADVELQANIDAEESARTAADEALSQAIADETSARTDADAALQEAIDNEASARTTADETLNNAITAETSARTAADEALSGAVDTKLQDYYLKSETSGKTEIQTALDGKSDKGHTHDERYYRKDETSGATELEGAFNRKLDASAYTPTDLSNYYTKDETSGKSEIASAISDEATARANADTALSGAVDTALLGYVNNAAYVSTAKTINLLHGETVIASVDATDFIKDGMVDNVVISGGSLVITFNTDSGKEAITIALTDIFDPANYYTKTEIDGIVSGKADTTAVTEAITEATSGKANSSDVYLKTETSGKTEIATALSAKLDTTAYTPTDLSNYYTKSETSGKSEISTALEAKLDTTAYTPTDLSNYYTKSETSGKTEISTALGTKQDTLVAGDNITISGNVISAAGGDLSNYYTKAEVDEMSEVAAQGINDLNTNKLDVTAYTPTDLSQYWTSAQTQSAISQSVSGKQDTLVSGTNIKTVNNESLLGSGNITIQGGGGNDVVELTQAEYDELVTSGTVDPDVFYVITDATPADLSNYYTKSETSGATELNAAFSAKLDATAYTPTDLSNYYTKSETSGKTELDAAFNGYVTTDTEQTISGRKVFTYSSSNSKAIEFKQTSDSNKVGFSIKNSADTNNEVASFEFRPNTFTIDGVQHPLMYFGHYRNTKTAAAGVQQTVIGFRQYDQLNEAAYHMLAPLPEKAKTPFSLTTAFQDFYMPMGFKNGSTMVKADETGVVDMSSEFSAKQDTLVSGTNIKTVNNESILGEGNIDIQGGGKAIEAGRGIAITTGETADTINCTLPITASSSAFQTISVGTNSGGGSYNTLIGPNARCDNNNGHNVFLVTQRSSNSSAGSYVNGANNVIIGSIKEGYTNFNIPSFTTSKSVVIGGGGISTDKDNSVAIGYLANVSGTTQTNINNQLKIDTDNQIYIKDKTNTNEICLQDYLGGGSSINVVQTTGTSTGDVMSQDAVTTALSGKQGTLTTGHLVDITNGTISVDLPISAGTSGNYSMLIGAPDINSVASGDCAIASGYYNRAYGDYARADGQGNEAVGNYSYALGCYNSTANEAEFSIGKYNHGRVVYDGEGIVDYTVFTVGNGTSIDARHNAFEVRNSGDIYITSGNSDIKLQDYLGGVNSSTVQTMIDNSISAKADTTAVTTTLGNYYTKSQTSGASEITQALQAKANGSDVYLKSETSGATEITVALINKADTSAVTEVATAVATKANSADVYDKTAADILLDGKANVTDVYTKAQTSGSSEIATALLDKADKGDSYLKSETSSKTQIDIALVAKANVTDVYTKSETSGKTELSLALAAKLDATAYTPTDLSNYYTKSETSGKSEISTALAAKLDATAYTPTDLSNYYTKSETSGKSEISTALAAKQDTLSAGTGIDITSNVISVTGGGGSSINVVQTTGTSTGDVMSQDAVTTALSGKADAANLGGLKLQQISQSAYDALTTKNASTLYIIVG